MRKFKLCNYFLQVTPFGNGNLEKCACLCMYSKYNMITCFKLIRQPILVEIVCYLNYLFLKEKTGNLVDFSNGRTSLTRRLNLSGRCQLPPSNRYSSALQLLKE